MVGPRGCSVLLGSAPRARAHTCSALPPGALGFRGSPPPPDFKSAKAKERGHLTNRSLSRRPSNQSGGARISHGITNSPSCIMHADASRGGGAGAGGRLGGDAEGASLARPPHPASGPGGGRRGRGGPGVAGSSPGRAPSRTPEPPVGRIFCPNWMWGPPPPGPRRQLNSALAGDSRAMMGREERGRESRFRGGDAGQEQLSGVPREGGRLFLSSPAPHLAAPAASGEGRGRSPGTPPPKSCCLPSFLAPCLPWGSWRAC